jgi:FKBP-type peptidyl-prolyl cis-trans isomerase
MKNVFTSSLAGGLALSAILFAACADSSYTTTELKPEVGKMVTLPAGLQYTILTPGTGAPALPGHQVTVNYTGRLTNGKVFDTSIGRQPFVFMLGAGQVIMGWDIGVAGMKVGEKRRLTIPASLGYGPSGTGNIPPNSVLIFDVELLDAK